MKVQGRQGDPDAEIIQPFWPLPCGTVVFALTSAAAVHSALHLVSELSSCFCRGKADSLIMELARVRCSHGCSRPASTHVTPCCCEEAELCKQEAEQYGVDKL